MKRKLIIITFCITLLFINSNIVFPQTKTVLETSFNCESLRKYYEGLGRMYNDTENETPFLPLIMIARLGNKERNNNLNWQRLKVAEQFAHMHFMPDVITAQGKKTKGLGQVEVYYGGVLRLVILAQKNEKFDEKCL